MVNIRLGIDSGCCIAIQVLNYELALEFRSETGVNLKGMCEKLCNERALCFDMEYV